MKRILFIFLLLVALPPVWAQEQGDNGEKVDVVYLTNGVVVRGHIVSSGDGEMMVRTLDGQTKRFALMEVETTSSELVQAKPEIKKDFYEPGFRGFVELGYGFDVNNTSDVFEFNFIGGYRFSKRFFLGLGVGWNQPTMHTRLHLVRAMMQPEKRDRGGSGICGLVSWILIFIWER